MSKTIKQCTNCDTSNIIDKDYFEDNEDDEDFINYMRGFVTFEPDDDINEYFPNITFSSYEKDYNNNICPYCKNTLEDTLISEDDFYAIGEYSNYNRDLILAMIELRKKDVIEFETKMQPFRQKEKKFEEKNQRLAETSVEKDKVNCPKCGSTNITEGTKGFSIMTGFIGSSNFRYVCKNCGNKWKPGSMLETLQRANNRH